MIKWYFSNNLEINFDKIPSVGIRYALPSMTEEAKKSILKFPFINKRELKIEIFYLGEKFNFSIEKNFLYDGMSIPRVVWSFLGISKENPAGLIASLVHDYLCLHKTIIKNNRALSTNVFAALLNVGGINPIKCFLMKNSVALFQTLFCKW